MSAICEKPNKVTIRFKDGGTTTADVIREREEVETANPIAIERMVCEQGTIWWHDGACWWVGRGEAMGDAIDVKSVTEIAL